MSTPAQPSGSRPAPRQLLGLFLVSCSTLLLQVTWTRVLSVSLWYHFAFLVVSTALLGFGLSGVLLTISRRLRELEPTRGLVLAAASQTVSILVGFAVANRIPFAPFSLLADPRQLLFAPLFVLCIAAPFVCAGVCAALLLSRNPGDAGRIYFFDLLGAGIGCFIIVLVMPTFGGSGSVLLCAALSAAATLAFAAGRSRLLAAGALLILAAAVPWADRLLPIRVSATKTGAGMTSMRELLESPQNLYTGWNTFSRIDVLPASWGREILIDAGTAMTRMPRVSVPPHRLGPVRDERALVLRPEERPSVLVIGSGGGWEVLAALRNNARQVTAVEVNPLINNLVRGAMAEFVGGIFADPRVELVTAEARSYIRGANRQWDVILASHTISNAATASGALSLAENYVMTLEAFSDYLAHLSPRGYLWFSRPEAQLPRMVATAREALLLRGISDARSHLIVFAGGQAPSFYGGFVLGMAPFSTERVLEAEQQLRRSQLRALYLPGRGGELVYERLIGAAPSQLATQYAESPTQLAPATDDRPFFNQRTRWSSMRAGTLRQVFDQGARARMALEDQPVAESVLVVVLVQSTLLATLLIVAPLLWRRRLAGLAGNGRRLSFFLCLGLGFILCEIGLIQRLTLFLGQPVHTFAVVVGSLLISSGLGSLITGRVASHRLRARILAAVLTVAVLINLVAFASPALLRACLGLPLAARVTVTVLLLLPLGLAMGMPFPLALRHAGTSAPDVIPWAWGLNAVASVVGSVAAIILATVIGFTGVFVAAAAIYLLAALLHPA